MMSYMIAVKLSRNASLENASFAKKESQAASTGANALASPGGRHEPRNSRSSPVNKTRRHTNCPYTNYKKPTEQQQNLLVYLQPRGPRDSVVNRQAELRGRGYQHRVDDLHHAVG